MSWRDVQVPTLAHTTWGQLREEFVSFCRRVTIDAKELGTTRMHLLSSQVYLLDEIFMGLAEGYHDFVILKARQLGTSTLLWAFDLFWLMKFSGLQGFYVADSDPNKELHRDTIAQMLESLPVKLRRQTRVSNRLQLAWVSIPGVYRGSRLMF